MMVMSSKKKLTTDSAKLADTIKLEILQTNHLEHFKFKTDLARIFGAAHPKRLRIAESSSNLIEQMRILQSKIKKP